MPDRTRFVWQPSQVVPDADEAAPEDHDDEDADGALSLLGEGSSTRESREEVKEAREPAPFFPRLAY